MSSGDGVILVKIKAKSAKLELELGLSLAIACKKKCSSSQLKMQGLFADLKEAKEQLLRNCLPFTD